MDNNLIDRLIYLFLNKKCSFRLRMCIFVVPSNICLPAAFPRSYVRIMQPILQRRSKLFIKSATPLSPPATHLLVSKLSAGV